MDPYAVAAGEGLCRLTGACRYPVHRALDPGLRRGDGYKKAVRQMSGGLLSLNPSLRFFGGGLASGQFVSHFVHRRLLDLDRR